MKVRPLQDRILVRRVAEEEKTKGGIIIPDSAKEKPAEGEVIAVGSGKVDDKGKLRPLAVKKGQNLHRVTKSMRSGSVLERRAIEGNGPVHETYSTSASGHGLSVVKAV
jgi:co-chaperonin GroES (HSP10)